MLKIVLLSASFFLAVLQGKSQELWGAANSNYAGAMGHDLNPASIVATPFKWELHVISASGSVMNNYVYLKKNSRAFRNGLNGEGLGENRFSDRYTTNDKEAYGSAFVKLPSFMYSTKKWGLGFHVATRAAASARGVPYHLAKFMYEGFFYDPQQQIDYTGGNMSVAGMNWHEAGVTGGIMVFNRPDAALTAGISINYLYGLNSYYLQVDKINYNMQADTLWQIDIADVEYGHAYSEIPRDFWKKKGGGVSSSVGVQYYRNRNDIAYDPCLDNKQKKYDYKIGLSIIDIGYIKFNRITSKYFLTDVSSDWYGIDTVKINGVTNADSIFNNQFFGSPAGGLAASGYTLWMPAAASIQFDYSLTPSIYLNFSAIQRLPISDYAIKRANQLSITARYETKQFEIAIPYSFYDYFRHRIGVAIRYGIFTVGTDMIGPYTGLSNAYGMDFYFGIKWQGFQSCGSKVRNHKSFKGSRTDCFDKF